MSTDWTATYRLQLHAGFTLAQASEILPYLAALGISHVYLSPCLQARPGSTHGYDVTDPSRISVELGGEQAWAEFQTRARDHGLRLLLDIVPNHMATAGENPWWDDVLAHGPYSEFSAFFDIVPRPDDPAWRLHLAPLGRPYGEALAAGELRLELHDGYPRINYFDQSWPIGPASWDLILSDGAADDPVFGELARLAPAVAPGLSERVAFRALTARAAELLASANRAGKLAPIIARLTGDPDSLHALLERQFYALHVWKLEGETVNYRRFFDLGSLVGLRMEAPEVFAAANARIAAMITAGEIDGLRLDHPDGLRDPLGYFRRLRELLPEGRVYVEKILDNDERLREDWPVDGTVGYEFLSKVNRLWMDDQKADAFNALYASFTGHSVNFPKVVSEKKRAIVEGAFAGELDRLTGLAMGIAQASWRTRDLSRRQLREAIKQLTTALPVYRTYRTNGPPDPTDRRLLADAFTAARVAQPELASSVFEFLEGLFADENLDERELEFVARWQQLCPAVTAKGVEDTTFYCYDRLVSCNEVGAQPSLIGIPSEKFHEFCHYLSERWPRNLLTTSTHDTKRSEDVRARISVLTELPDRWGEALHQWSQVNAPAWKGRAPDRHAEYLLYQTLVGAWPIDRDRCWAYMLKACREAKILTSWHEPNVGYELAIQEFIDGVFATSEFVASLDRFVAPLVLPARINSLAQTLIKLTAPGVPDFYQGTELWDLSLVDPDNRRPVDYERRTSLLARGRSLPPSAVTSDWDSGLPKLWLIARVLEVRRACPRCFSGESPYHPIVAQGGRLGHVLAFARGENVIVAVPRFTYSLRGDWADTRLRLPDGPWVDRLSGAKLSGEIEADRLFGAFPVVLLVREDLA